MDTDPLRAFEIEALALEQVVGGFDDADFDRPTNCPPWTVRDLLGHLCEHIGRNEVPPYVPGARLDLPDAAAFYRVPVRRTAAYHEEIARSAPRFAAGFASGGAVAEELGVRWRDSFAAFVDLDPDAPVRTPQGVCRASDFLVTRVIAHAAHGLDLASSIGLRPWTTAEALETVRPVLVALAGYDPADRLGGDLAWDDATFLAAGTGRRVLTGEEASVLGHDAFPLLS